MCKLGIATVNAENTSSEYCLIKVDLRTKKHCGNEETKGYCVFFESKYTHAHTLTQGRTHTRTDTNVWTYIQTLEYTHTQIQTS